MVTSYRRAAKGLDLVSQYRQDFSPFCIIQNSSGEWLVYFTRALFLLGKGKG
jgi:hypothetical protein